MHQKLSKASSGMVFFTAHLFSPESESEGLPEHRSMKSDNKTKAKESLGQMCKSVPFD